jgi:hypothetical protein
MLSPLLFVVIVTLLSPTYASTSDWLAEVKGLIDTVPGTLYVKEEDVPNEWIPVAKLKALEMQSYDRISGTYEEITYKEVAPGTLTLVRNWTFTLQRCGEASHVQSIN